jgi:O-antigen ligase
MSVLCLTELNNSHGSVLWIFPTDYSEVFATFPSHNSYAQFIELALPIALWRAVRGSGRSWGYALASGLLFASVIGAASRVGAILCTAELLAILGYGLIKIANAKSRQSSRTAVAVIVMIPVLASLFTAVVGWEKVWQRLQESDPYIVRREFIVSAMEMARHRPLIGYGLGTFPEVYQQYAIKNFPFYANHTHNDWAEFAADGGIPFLLLIFLPCACAIPTALRFPWGIGLPAIMLHACVDFPFPRPAVSVWIFVLLGALYASRQRILTETQLVDGHHANATSASKPSLSNQAPYPAATGL